MVLFFLQCKDLWGEKRGRASSQVHQCGTESLLMARAEDGTALS